jgi:hypothetical protein
MTTTLSALTEPVGSPQTRASFAPGRLGEFLAVGGLTPVFFFVSWLLRSVLGLDAADYAVGFTFFYGAYLINDPHFTVTYLLFYRDFRSRAFGRTFASGQRARYRIAGIAAPLALASWALAALALRSAPALGFLIQTMFLLVGWHYVKQGFGVLVVLSARRGVRFTARERAVLLVHAYAAWAYAWASPADPGRLLEEKGVVYQSIPHSLFLEHLTGVVFLATIAPLAWVLVAKWKREGARLITPIMTGLAAFLFSTWAWTIYSSIDPLVRYAIPALHSVQYLYFVWLLRHGEAKEREGVPWFEPPGVKLGLLAAGALGLGVLLFHLVPSALDGALVPGSSRDTALGATPCFAALYAFVNLHHFFMDAVLWRRENPEMRLLTAARPAAEDARSSAADPLT